MARLPSCKWCGKKIEDKSNAIKHQAYWYHNKCFEENKDKIIKTRYPKCKVCGKEIKDKTDAINVSGFWYHNNCYELHKIKVAPKCKKCGKPILDKQNAIKKNNFYYCIECDNKIKEDKKLKKQEKIKEKERKEREKGELKKEKEKRRIEKIKNNKNASEKEKQDRKKLIDYIYELYNKEIPIFVFKQIKDYHDEYNMKYEGMLLTIKFMYEDLELQFEKENGIGLVLYYYDKCKSEYLRKKEIDEAIEEFEFEDKEVIVNKRFSGNINKKYKEIDIGEL